ncbi:MAG: dihydrodipicolinate synthase family protein [Gemmatimonadetes bacterium]|nr:dihydrodipicolinate synthase family protein [Gemmatimonadota bacterium]NIO33086.1 dihydrodipicolinate synthase family protein [Gemmatimonadota bacterium]
MRLAGVILPVTTPFDEASGAVAPVSFRDNLRAWLRAGVHGFVIAGSTGEAPLLDESEVVQMVEWARDVVPPEKILIAGTGAESTRATVRAARAVAEVGGDAVLVRAPSYYRGRMDPETVRRHYETVAESIPIPLILYNVPQFVPVDITPGLLAELGAHPNIAGIKDSTGDLKILGAHLEAAPEDCQVLVGAGSKLYAALEMGAAGGIVAVGCLAPELAVAVYEKFRADEAGQAGAAQDRISSPHTKIVRDLGVAGVKYALDLLGYVGGAPRAPLRPLDERGRAQVRSELSRARLLQGGDDG